MRESLRLTPFPTAALWSPGRKPIDIEALWAELSALGARDFLPGGLPDDPPVEPEDFAIG